MRHVPTAVGAAAAAALLLVYFTAVALHTLAVGWLVVAVAVDVLRGRAGTG